MPRMGPHGNGKIEKSKDFKGTLIKIFNKVCFVINTPE